MDLAGFRDETENGGENECVFDRLACAGALEGREGLGGVAGEADGSVGVGGRWGVDAAGGGVEGWAGEEELDRVR